MISKKSVSVRFEVNKQRRLGRKGEKASGKYGADRSGSRILERSGEKRAPNREKRV